MTEKPTHNYELIEPPTQVVETATGRVWNVVARSLLTGEPWMILEAPRPVQIERRSTKETVFTELYAPLLAGPAVEDVTITAIVEDLKQLPGHELELFAQQIRQAAGPAAPQTLLLEVADRLKTEMVWQRAHGNDTWPTLAADIELLADAILSRASSPSPSAALREKVETFLAFWDKEYPAPTSQNFFKNRGLMEQKVFDALQPLRAILNSGSTESP